MRCGVGGVGGWWWYQWWFKCAHCHCCAHHCTHKHTHHCTHTHTHDHTTAGAEVTESAQLLHRFPKSDHKGGHPTITLQASEFAEVRILRAFVIHASCFCHPKPLNPDTHKENGMHRLVMSDPNHQKKANTMHSLLYAKEHTRLCALVRPPTAQAAPAQRVALAGLSPHDRPAAVAPAPVQLLCVPQRKQAPRQHNGLCGTLRCTASQWADGYLLVRRATGLNVCLPRTIV